jgi:dihydrofolate synthase/folylpolyglutamate synthase
VPATTTYHDALAYIYSLTDYEQGGFAAYAPQNYDLERVRQLLDLVGNPQQTFESVHIAGTKGKGSTAAMVESVLRAAGYRTGLFTSPHLHTFRERIQASGNLIPEADVVLLVDEMRPLADLVDNITTFELMTALALAWFAREGVEWAVLEVGLGGRLDATNVVNPAVAVITSLSLDHTAVLGDTLAQIAAEKAGIIKPGVPVVSAPQPDEALDVIQATCARKAASLTLVGRHWTWDAGESTPDGQAFSVRHADGVMDRLWIPLLGEHQLVNATTAVATLSKLPDSDAAISEDAIREGLQRVRWPGRLEVLARGPWLVVDSAHNGDSATRLMAALRAHFSFHRLTVVVGASADHVTPEMMGAFLDAADRAIATQSGHPRAASPEWLRLRAEEMGFRMEACATVPEALDLALEGAAKGDLICFAGSVFVAAEARATWFERQGMARPPSDHT